MSAHQSDALVAEAIAFAAAAAGTRFAFGVPGGGSNLELVAACARHGIEFVLMHAETASVLAASAYAELTGAPGLALATRGPGAMSAVNGCAHAQLDRTPLLLVTDAVAPHDRGRTTHQLVDHHAVFTACAKASADVDPAGAVATANGAIALALRPPAGPVHLDTVANAASPLPRSDGSRPRGAQLPTSWKTLLTAARRPLLLVGVGARGSETSLRALQNRSQIPFLLTYKAKGILDETLPGFTGLLTGATIERFALDSADLLLAVGLDPVELIPASWPYAAPVLSLTPWPILDTYLGDVEELVAPVDDLLPQVAALLGHCAWEAPRAGLHLLDHVPALATENGIGPTALVKAVRAASPDGTIATVDAGAHMLVSMPLWTARRPGEALISSGLATMGYAVPAAIAASLARPRQRVVAFTGDGGLGMCLSELEVMARRCLDVLVVVFNDSRLSLIDVKQRTGSGGPGVMYNSTDFATAAVGLGISGTRIDTLSGLDAALQVWARSTGPRLFDVHVDPRQYPDVMKALRGA